MTAPKDDKLQQWILPDFDQQRSNQDELDLFGKPASWYQSEQPEEIEVPEQEQLKPLTLEDIESIRTSAYEDGFTEGKQAGFEQGLPEGKQQGATEGYQQGLDQGLAEGLAQGKAQIDAQLLHWQQLISRLHYPLEKLDQQVEFQLVKLATSLAEQMVRCEVSVNPQVILQALKQAVEALPVNEQSIVISLHPEDVTFVSAAFSEPELQKRGWDLRAEPTLLRGDCQIQTQTSSVDYTHVPVSG